MKEKVNFFSPPRNHERPLCFFGGLRGSSWLFWRAFRRWTISTATHPSFCPHLASYNRKRERVSTLSSKKWVMRVCKLPSRLISKLKCCFAPEHSILAGLQLESYFMSPLMSNIFKHFKFLIYVYENFYYVLKLLKINLYKYF